MYHEKKIIAINYCDKNFESHREYNTRTAYLYGGVDSVIEYSPEDIDTKFKTKNKSIFSEERGAGLWLWKPYIILRTLEKMQDGSFLFYCDAGAYYVDSLVKLLNVMEFENIDLMTFELPLLSRQWTKKETFTAIGYDSSADNQILAGYILMRNTPEVRRIINEWLFYMQDERCSSPRLITNELNNDDFVAHREDQSVFSIICRKNGVIPFKDPSQFGNRPWEYAWRKSYQGQWKKYTYIEKTYKNSPYSKVLVGNRKVNPIEYKKHESLIEVLWKLGIYNKYSYKWKYKTEYK